MDDLTNLKNRNVVTNKLKKGRRLVAGIDEAGRGPVIGPMVYAIFLMEEDDKRGFMDSKMLKRETREMFFKEMDNYATIAIDPTYITNMMEIKKLNMIAHEAVIRLLEMIEGYDVVKVYVDGLGNNKTYKEMLENKFKYEFIVENKADKNYPVVGGASIVAKVTRDKIVEKYKAGSGYPSDPSTKKWLLNNIDFLKGYPLFVRHSWETVKRLLGRKENKSMLGGVYHKFYREHF